MASQRPWKVEYAKSSRSSCRTCKSPISKEILRLGKMVQSKHFDGLMPNRNRWFQQRNLHQLQHSRPRVLLKEVVPSPASESIKYSTPAHPSGIYLNPGSCILVSVGVGFLGFNCIISMAESSEQQQQRFIIGYALASKKQQSFIQPSLINHAKERGIDLIKIETDNELLINLNGPFDCILHKVYSEDWKRQLTDFQSANPNVVIIDSPEATELLHSRISMFHAVSQALLKIHVTTSVGIAKQIVIYDANPSSSESLKFPVIWKPLVVTDPKSQKMLLASSHTVLINNLKPPVVLQEFVNHGGVVFKVYVAGKHVRYVRRKFSLPEDKVDQEDSTETEIMPPEWLISAISKGLRESLKLNLFSFSVIRDTTVQRVRYVVIDMSYFPDYSKLPHYESLLTDFFCDLVAAKKDKEELDAGVKNNSSFRRHPRKQKTPVRSPSS